MSQSKKSCHNNKLATWIFMSFGSVWQLSCVMISTLLISEMENTLLHVAHKTRPFFCWNRLDTEYLKQKDTKYGEHL